jgi:hypothetical protein
MAVPNIFATTQTGNVPASRLDENFAYLLVPGNTSAASVVSDLAALKALTTRPEAVLVETGQAKGVWQWELGSSTTADDALVVTPTSGTAGRYKRVYDWPVFASWWGAAPSASAATNTTAVNAALAAVGAAGGGTVMIDVPGAYSVTDSNPSPGLQIDHRAIYIGSDNVTLEFCPGASLFLANSSDCHVIAVGDFEDAIAPSNVSIIGAEIDGNRANQTTPNDTDDHWSGIMVMAGCSRVSIRQSYIHDCAYYGIGFETKNFTDCLIEDCIIEDVGADGIDCKDGHVTLDTPISQGNVIRHVTVRGHGLAGATLSTAQAGIDCRGGWVIEDVCVLDYGGVGVLPIGIRLQQEAFNGAGPPSTASLPLQTTTLKNFFVKPSTSTDTWGVRSTIPQTRIENGEIKGCAQGMRVSYGRPFVSDITIDVPASSFGLVLAAANSTGVTHGFFSGIKIVGDGSTTVGIDGDGDSDNNTFSGCAIVSHLTGLDWASGATNNKFLGGVFASNTKNLLDNGTGSTFRDVVGLPRMLELRGAQLYDHFLGNALRPEWKTTLVGSDPQCVVATIVTSNPLNGRVRLTAGDDAGATMALNGVSMVSALNWRAENGGLAAEWDVTLGSTAAECVYLGFTDDVSTLEMPFTLGGSDALTSNASSACGVLYDTAADTDQWCLVGVAANVDATQQFIGSAPVAGTFERFRVEISTTGVATFSRNGVQIGTAMTGAVAAAAPLTPIVAIFSRTSATKTVDVDFFNVEQDEV